MSHAHEIVKCNQCERVIRQCRCPSENKPVRFEYCGCNETRSQLDYSIALQRAIETHCRGEFVCEDQGGCPHHAKMLNSRLEKQNQINEAAIKTIQLVMGVITYRSAAWMELREVVRLLGNGESKYFGIGSSKQLGDSE